GLYDRIGMEASIESAEAVEGFVAFRERRSPTLVHPDLRVDGRRRPSQPCPRRWSLWWCSRCSVCSDSSGALGFNVGEPDRLGFAVSGAALVHRNGLPGWASSYR